MVRTVKIELQSDPAIPLLCTYPKEKASDLMHLTVKEGRSSHSHMVALLATRDIPEISQAWWWAPVIPATQEAETELLEPGRQSLQ